MTRQDPKAFIGGGISPAAAYNAAQYMPPQSLLPTLSVSAKGHVYIRSALRTHLGLSPNQPIDLIQPNHGSPYWHLDIRPVAPSRLYWYEDTRPKLIMSRLPLAGLVRIGRPLVLRLLPGEPAYAGFYPLVPDPS